MSAPAPPWHGDELRDYLDRMHEHSLDAVEAVLRTSRPTPSEPANRHLAMLLWGKALHHDEPAGDASPTAKSFVQTRLQPAAAGTPRMQARDEAAGTSPATAKVYGAKGADQMIREIAAQELDPEHFISAKVKEIADAVGDGMAINALSGGVDSSTVTMLGHRALGQRLKTVFIQNGLMRQGEPEQVVGFFRDLGVAVEVVDAQNEFSAALKGVVDPEEKREAITQTFYREVFGRIVRESGARYLLQGTILTDVDETVAGIKRQHNVFEQLGIDPQEAFGYSILEPLIQLRKDGVRKIGKALGLPAELFERIPFPGPALSARVIGEATPERIETVRKATAVVERLLKGSGAFQYMAILHEDRVTGMRDGKRDFGQQIEVRCWDSVDARTATPTRLSFELLEQVAAELIRDLPGIVSVSYNIAPKPPSTIEAV